MNNIRFTCASLANTGKKGILVPDADGYYTQTIGGLSIFNSAGHFYEANRAALSLFENSSAFMRRVKRGALRAEVDHPEWKKGMTEDEYAARMMTIDPRNECAHFSEIFLDTKNFKNADGTPVVAIMGKFKPSGVHGEMLQKKVDNGKENVCFSIRAFTQDTYQRGVRHRTLCEVITFDYVNEPGIHIAEKFKSPTLESYVDKTWTRETIEKACDRQVLNFGRESVTLSKEQLFESFGWKEQSMPGFTRW